MQFLNNFKWLSEDPIKNTPFISNKNEELKPFIPPGESELLLLVGNNLLLLNGENINLLG